MSNNKLILILIFIIIFIAFILFYKNRTENMNAFSSLSRQSPYYETIPDLASAIGGKKGYSVRTPESIGAYGLYSAQKSHIARGYPNTITAKRTLIKPSQIGFSYNSLVNRDTYSDFYDSVGDRRKNPTFKYITKFTGLNLDPVRWSMPTYRFARI